MTERKKTNDPGRGSTGSKRVFVDMDGVLCEYKTEATQQDYESEGYFAALAPRSSMIDAVKRLISSDSAEVFVLSSVIPKTKDRAEMEKNEWLDRYLPDIDRTHRIFPVCGSSKADAAGVRGPSDILLDDYSENLRSWSEAGGSAFKIINEINGKRGSFTAGPRIAPGSEYMIKELVEAI